MAGGIKMSCEKAIECPCPKKECANHHTCYPCIIKHKNTDSLPFCLFEDNDGDKSNLAYFKKLKERFEDVKIREKKKIWVNYSRDILKGTLEVLNASNLKELVEPRMKVSIKPNLVLDKPASQGATTHPEVVEGIICYLQKLGVTNIEIIESSWVGGDTKEAFKVCGYEKLSRKYNVPLYDLKDDKIVLIDGIEVCKKAIETDFLINVPVLKAHCQTLLTCCMKNLKGCISDKEKRRFHTLGLHKPIAALNVAIKTHFCVIDGICGDLNFEEGGTPVERNMILAGDDPLFLDSYCATLIGYSSEEIGYLGYGSNLGVGELFKEGEGNPLVIELNTDNKPKGSKIGKSVARHLSKFINEDSACSACYSALIYALYNTERNPKGKISIGQGFIGKSGEVGCGNCTSGFDEHISGCPPKAAKIVEFLKES
jgi:uncharacterized protein (DUF362 family)